jgi:hypothetical protein
MLTFKKGTARSWIRNVNQIIMIYTFCRCSAEHCDWVPRCGTDPGVGVRSSLASIGEEPGNAPAIGSPLPRGGPRRADTGIPLHQAQNVPLRKIYFFVCRRTGSTLLLCAIFRSPSPPRGIFARNDAVLSIYQMDGLDRFRMPHHHLRGFSRRRRSILAGGWAV